MDKYISIRQIADDLYDDDMMKDLSFERIINYAVEFMKIVGAPSLTEDKECELVIDNYRSILPNDFYMINQVKNKDNNLCYIEALNTFKDEIDDLAYKLQGRYIYVNTEKDRLILSYKAFVVDEDGYPMLLNDASFIRALELYIQKKWYTKLFNKSAIPMNVLQNIQQEYAFAVGQAQTSLVMPSVDKLQAILNMWGALLPRTFTHNNGFRDLGRREPLRF